MDYDDHDKKDGALDVVFTLLCMEDILLGCKKRESGK